MLKITSLNAAIFISARNIRTDKRLWAHPTYLPNVCIRMYVDTSTLHLEKRTGKIVLERKM